MKIRMYMDIHPYVVSDGYYNATSQPYSDVVPEGFKRVAFDVDIPDEHLKKYDFEAKAELVEVKNECVV